MNFMTGAEQTLQLIVCHIEPGQLHEVAELLGKLS